MVCHERQGCMGEGAFTCYHTEPQDMQNDDACTTVQQDDDAYVVATSVHKEACMGEWET